MPRIGRNYHKVPEVFTRFRAHTLTERIRAHGPVVKSDDHAIIR